MPALFHHCASLSLLLVATTSCTIWHSGDKQAMQWHVDLPADAAAAIVSAALSADLHAEPTADASGAPVTPCGQGYRIEWTSDALGNWLPIASHRLVLRAHRQEPKAELVQSSLSGFRGQTRRRVVVEVLTAATGCTLRLRAATPDFEQLAAALQRTVSLACSIDGSGPGLAEANLAAWRLTNLLGEASGTTDQGRRSNLMRRAARQPTAPSWLFEDLAEIAASNGQFAEAAKYANHGMLVEADPLGRAHLAKLAHQFALRTKEPPDLRAQAIDRLNSGDIQIAEKLLHSARRADSRPAVDYRLLGKLHRQRGDEMAALAAELLAREYDADSPLNARDTRLGRNQGITDRLRQITSRRVARASMRSRKSPQEVATPIR